MPAFKTNENVASIELYCQDTLSCDLHYSLDWYYLAQLENLKCAELA